MSILKIHIFSLLILTLSACGGDKKSSTNSGSDPKSTKKIFLIGDSTMHIHSSDYLLNTVRMTCGSDNPDNILTGWGDELHVYAQEPNNIINRARAGSSSVSYRSDENYDKDKFGENRHWSYTKALMEEAKDGFLLIQFGSGNENNHAPSDTDYNNDGFINRADEILRIALRKSNFEEAIGNYIKEAREVGVTPILISPPDGRFKGTSVAGTHPHTRGSFPNYLQQLGTTYGVVVLDLNDKSNKEFAKLTNTELLQNFGDCAKNNGRGTIDYSHYEPKGARTVAGWVKELTCPKNDNNEDRILLCKQFKTSATVDEPDNSVKDTVYEDAEDGNTNGWAVFDSNPAASAFSNVFDLDKNSNVIEFTGDGTKNGYSLGNTDGQTGAWNNVKSTKVEWSMKYNTDFKVYFNVRTKDWTGYLYYTPENTNEGITTAGSSTFLHLGLGTNLINGTWQTITRDLQQDLHLFEPSNNIIAINGFFIRGNGRVDDIKILNESTKKKIVILNELKAFPTAEGAGANTEGGRFGKVIYVENHDASGEGSLKWALEQEYPRTILFAVGGRFNINQTIRLGRKKTNYKPDKYSHVTLAGQTANDIGGVHLTRSNFNHCQGDSSINFYRQNEIILRYFDSRYNWQFFLTPTEPRTCPGGTKPDKGQQIPTLRIMSAKNVVIDHISSGWSGYGLIVLNLSAFPTETGNITIQRSLMHENIMNPEGIDDDQGIQYNHNIGMLLGNRGTGGSTENWNKVKDFSVHKNAFIGTSHRYPNTAGGNKAKFRVINNYIYGFRGDGTGERLSRIAGNSQNDFINNTYQEATYGKQFTESNLLGFQFNRFLPDDPNIIERPNFYIDGNLFLDKQGRKNDITNTINSDGRKMIFRYDSRPKGANLIEGDRDKLIFRNKPLSVLATLEHPVSVLSVDSVKENILTNVGGNIQFKEDGSTFITDEIDKKYIDWARNYTGPTKYTTALNDNDVGSHQNFIYPVYQSGARNLLTFDWDKDGMPDEWEKRHELTERSSKNDHENRQVRENRRWEFDNYIVINNAGYTNLEMYLADIAGDFHMLSNQR